MPAISKLTDDQWDMVKTWERNGLSRPEMVDRIRTKYDVTITRSGLGRALGVRGYGQNRPPSRGTKSHKIYLSPYELSRARRIAAMYGERTASGEGNLSGLIRSIVAGELLVVINNGEES